MLGRWSKKEDEILTKIYPIAYYWEDIYKQLPGRNQKGIQRRAWRLGIKKALRNCGSSNLLDEAFFDTWNEKSAYLLGYLEADGYFVKNRNSTITIRFGTTKKDLKFLKQLRTLITSNAKIYFSKVKLKGYSKIHECSGFCLTSERWARKLDGNYRTQRIPECITEELIPHYIRGYFDGDGCIGKFKNNTGKKKYYSSFVFSSLELANNFGIALQKLIGTKEPIPAYKKKDFNVWQISLTRPRTAKLMYILYSQATIYLERKQKLAIQAIQAFKEHPTIMSGSFDKRWYPD